MKPILPFLCLLLAAKFALAEVNYSIAKEQARRTQNQGGIVAGNQTPPPSAPAADPELQATLRNLASLRADIAALNDTGGGKPDPTIKPSLLNDLTAAAQGTKPRSASVQKLAGHLMTALINKKMLAPQQAKLARELHAAFNGAHLSATPPPALWDDVKKILTDAGTPADDADKIADDLRQIAAETK